MRLAVLGTGNMGRALIRRLLERGEGAVELRAWDREPAARGELPEAVRWETPERWFSAGAVPEVVLIAVKPADVASAVSPVARCSGSERALWCSIAAGVTIEKLEQFVGAGRRVCRIMPNTPALIGQGISAFAVNEHCTEQDARTVPEILGVCGEVVQVDEKQMDAITGLSGSGPAYVYTFIEALIEGGVSAGLPYGVARSLAVQTVRGAAAMVGSTDQPPAALKAAVMSPGGTTARGLLELEKNGFRFAVINAVVEAARRSKQLGT